MVCGVLLLNIVLKIKVISSLLIYLQVFSISMLTNEGQEIAELNELKYV